jgi:hypothetical protein
MRPTTMKASIIHSHLFDMRLCQEELVLIMDGDYSLIDCLQISWDDPSFALTKPMCMKKV